MNLLRLICILLLLWQMLIEKVIVSEAPYVPEK